MCQKNPKIQPSGMEPLAPRLQSLQNPKWLVGGTKMADGDWKGVYPYVFGHSFYEKR